MGKKSIVTDDHVYWDYLKDLGNEVAASTLYLADMIGGIWAEAKAQAEVAAATQHLKKSLAHEAPEQTPSIGAKCYSVIAAPGSSFGGENQTKFTGVATMTQIASLGEEPVKVMLNGDRQAVFTLQGGDTQIFSDGELPIRCLDFENSTNSATTLEVIVVII